MKSLLLLLPLIAVPCVAQPLPSSLMRGETIPLEVEAMYQRGLAYLAATQTPEGNWPDQQGLEPGVVGIALLAFLGHGEDPNYGPYREVMHRALDFILRSQDAESGYIGNTMYNHGFATLALAEAYGSLRDERIAPALKNAVDLILRSQKSNKEGGWRYAPFSNDADTTVSGAQMVALYAARNAGIDVPDEAIKRGLAYFVDMQDSRGGVGYTNNTGANSTRTAIASLCFSLNKDRSSPPAVKAFAYSTQNADTVGNSYPYYHFYYMAQSLFHGDMDAWRIWNRQIQELLANLQTSEGAWDSRHGPAFGTSAALLTLALNYRMMPIYER